jgi:HSP20 family molecular chaperone IbpA
MSETAISKAENTAASENLDAKPGFTPLVDIYENDRELIVLADLPGVIPDALGVHLEKGRLSLTGKVTPDGEEPFEYKRTFLVPNGIDAEKIEATLALGVLKVVLPKSQANQPRRIAVRGA